jgi:hypothetical protein
MPYKPPIVRCQGTTKAGKPCKRPPARGELYCREHLIIEQAPAGLAAEIARRVEAHGAVPRVRAGTEVLNLATGELVELGTAKHSDLHALIADLREHVESVQAAIRLVEREVCHRMDAAGTWTIRTDYGVMTSSSPAPKRVVEDPLELRQALLEAGFPETTVDKAVEKVVPPVQYKVRAAGIRALLKVEAAERVIDAHSRLVRPSPDDHRRVDLKTSAR